MNVGGGNFIKITLIINCAREGIGGGRMGRERREGEREREREREGGRERGMESRILN